MRKPLGWIRVTAAGGMLLAISGCLGPNPGFFISTGIANTTIMNITNRFLNALLGS